LMLHRAGEIELPPIRFKTLNPFVRRATPALMLIDTTPIAGRSPGTPANRTATGAANRRRTAIQQSDGAASLFKVRTTSWGALEISGLVARPSYRVPGVEF